MSQQGFGCSAVIDAQGSYSLRSQYGRGIPLGTYKVVVTPPAEIRDEFGDSSKFRQNARIDIPKKYRDFAISGLEVTLTGKSVIFDINMEGK